MSAQTSPLAILDLSPISAGSTAAQALRNTLDLARRAEELGYRRYWLAEHHFAAVASSAPAVLAGQVLAATESIIVGAGAVQIGQRTAASVAAEWGTLDALYPGRVDLGLGRSGHRLDDYRRALQRELHRPATVEPRLPLRIVEGVVLPELRDLRSNLESPRAAIGLALLTPPGPAPDYGEQVGQVLDLLAGNFRPDELAEPLQLTPGEGGSLRVWSLGSSPSGSAPIAGRFGLPFVANYHLAPGQTLETVQAYRDSFQPGVLTEPYVAVSADVLAADTEEEAQRIGRSFVPWLDSVSKGHGAIPVPAPDDVDEFDGSLLDRHSDRLATRFVGTAELVVERLAALRALTGADELLLTTLTHSHADRLRSYELISRAWS